MKSITDVHFNWLTNKQTYSGCGHTCVAGELVVDWMEGHGKTKIPKSMITATLDSLLQYCASAICVFLD